MAVETAATARRASGDDDGGEEDGGDEDGGDEDECAARKPWTKLHSASPSAASETKDTSSPRPESGSARYISSHACWSASDMPLRSLLAVRGGAGCVGAAAVEAVVVGAASSASSASLSLSIGLQRLRVLVGVRRRACRMPP